MRLPVEPTGVQAMGEGAPPRHAPPFSGEEDPGSTGQAQKRESNIPADLHASKTKRMFPKATKVRLGFRASRSKALPWQDTPNALSS